MERLLVDANAHWAEAVSYSRAVRVGDHVFVAGTTASGPDGVALNPGDAGAQARDVMERIAAALAQVGADLSDVVRTRCFLTRVADWEAVGRIHGEIFAEVRPASTMLEVSRLLHPTLLVEIEAEAIVTRSP